VGENQRAARGRLEDDTSKNKREKRWRASEESRVLLEESRDSSFLVWWG
jgi:hypothetical protein